MINSQEYLKKFIIERKYKSSKEKELAKEIYRFFGKKLNFGLIMNLIKTKGYKAIYEIFNDVKNSDAQNLIAFFFYKIKNEKIIFKNCQESYPQERLGKKF